jgi:serine/threonine protein kinase
MDIIKNILKEKKLIGRGSFGKIYHSEKYPNYIVKKMNKMHICNIEYICNNIKELWWQIILSKINLNNVSKIKSYHIDCEFIYMLMKYNGTSIYNKVKEINLINDTELKIKKHIELLKCIPNILFSCSKVFYCLHRCKMRHGDITTSNILINENNEVFIIDWGSVIFNKVRTSFYNQCAIIFSAPELKNNEKNIFQNTPSIKNDIFSLGLVILSILDINSKSIDSFNKYIDLCKIYDTDIANDELDIILKKINEKYIYENVDERVFFLLKKMLEYNIETRIDIESLYMDIFFSDFRKKDVFDKNVIYNFFKNTNHTGCYPIDEHNNILVVFLYNFLKKYKEPTQNIQIIHKSKIFDTRIVFDITIKLFYNYKNRKHQNNNINTYIISFLGCLKWIDTILNDEIIIKEIYPFYLELFSALEFVFEKENKLNFCDFCVSFDLIFFDIFKTLEEYIFSYPDILDLNYSKISFRELKNKLLIK